MIASIELAIVLSHIFSNGMVAVAFQPRGPHTVVLYHCPRFILVTIRHQSMAKEELHNPEGYSAGAIVLYEHCRFGKEGGGKREHVVRRSTHAVITLCLNRLLSLSGVYCITHDERIFFACRYTRLRHITSCPI